MCVSSQMPPSPANTLDPSRSSRQQQHNPAELYAPFSPTSVPSGSYALSNTKHKRRECTGGNLFYRILVFEEQDLANFEEKDLSERACLYADNL